MTQPHSADLYAMCLEHFNQPMISFGELARCVGYAETALDCYILVKKRWGQIIWHTCVGGYVFLDTLKGQGVGGEWDDLKRLDSDLTNSGCEKEGKFLLKLRHHDAEHIPGDLDDRARAVAVQILLQCLPDKPRPDHIDCAKKLVIMGLLAERELCAEIAREHKPVVLWPHSDAGDMGRAAAAEEIESAIEAGGHL